MLTSVIGDVHTIEDVVAAMRAIEAALPENDGVRWFNVLYRWVTEAVRADGSPWADWPFLERFDVAFAKLYFEAMISWESNPAGAPKPGDRCSRRAATGSRRCSSRWPV